MLGSRGIDLNIIFMCTNPVWRQKLQILLQVKLTLEAKSILIDIIQIGLNQFYTLE